MKPPKRLFRDRRRAEPPHDRRRVDYGDDPVVETPDLSTVMDLARHIVYVPVHDKVETDTDYCLDGLKELGIVVRKSKGASAIDLTRNVLASDAVRAGIDSLLFIDADMLFDPADAVRLFLSPEPVIAGVYASKKLKTGQLNVDFGPGQLNVRLGDWVEHPYPALKVGAGFLRIKVDFLKRMIRELKLPYCRMAEKFGWPFFQPVVVDEGNGPTYYPEDYAFSWRCHQVGVPPMVDTSFRLYHLGSYAFGWEEADGQYLKRSRNLLSKMHRPTGEPFVMPDLTERTTPMAIQPPNNAGYRPGSSYPMGRSPSPSAGNSPMPQTGGSFPTAREPSPTSDPNDGIFADNDRGVTPDVGANVEEGNPLAMSGMAPPDGNDAIMRRA